MSKDFGQFKREYCEDGKAFSTQPRPAAIVEVGVACRPDRTPDCFYMTFLTQDEKETTYLLRPEDARDLLKMLNDTNVETPGFLD